MEFNKKYSAKKLYHYNPNDYSEIKEIIKEYIYDCGHRSSNTLGVLLEALKASYVKKNFGFYVCLTPTSIPACIIIL